MTPRPAPVSPEAVRERARTAFRRHGATWAAWHALPTDQETRPPGGAPRTSRESDEPPGQLDPTGAVTSEALLDVPLHPPTESSAMTDVAAATSWVACWRNPGLHGDVEVVWDVRTWASLGRQEVPTRVRLRGGEAIASAAGARTEWNRLVARCAALADRWGRSDELGAALRRHSVALAALSDGDTARLVAVVDWFVAHPTSGLLVRQVPVPGVHSKWLETHRGLVTGLVAALTGSPDLGLSEPDRLIRLRILDPLLRPGGLHDLAAPLGDLARLHLPARRVIVVENLASLHALPDSAGAVAIHGSGFAVEVLRHLPWVGRAAVTYWGDLDSNGFAILDRLRAHAPHAASVLMDLATLHAYRDLCVHEPSPWTAALTRLTDGEQAARAELALLGNLRLEQERLPWPVCVAALWPDRTPEGVTPGELDP